MRTCTLCNAQSPDTETQCSQCGADLLQYSTTAVALTKLKANSRVSHIQLIIAKDVCFTCRAAEREYDKNQVPEIPINGCSNPNGCRCFYAPFLVEIYP